MLFLYIFLYIPVITISPTFEDGVESANVEASNYLIMSPHSPTVTIPKWFQHETFWSEVNLIILYSVLDYSLGGVEKLFCIFESLPTRELPFHQYSGIFCSNLANTLCHFERLGECERFKLFNNVSIKFSQIKNRKSPSTGNSFPTPQRLLFHEK